MPTGITTSPYAVIANELKTVIETEFAVEQFKVRLDNIHESLGIKRVDIGIAPVDDVPYPGDVNTAVNRVEIRFYLPWQQSANGVSLPEIVVDPTKITVYAERFKAAVRNANQQRNGLVWDYSIGTITFPPDPTGNKTRFHAMVSAIGNNTSHLSETLA